MSLTYADLCLFMVAIRLLAAILQHKGNELVVAYLGSCIDHPTILHVPYNAKRVIPGNISFVCFVQCKAVTAKLAFDPYAPAPAEAAPAESSAPATPPVEAEPAESFGKAEQSAGRSWGPYDQHSGKPPKRGGWMEKFIHLAVMVEHNDIGWSKRYIETMRSQSRLFADQFDKQMHDYGQQ